MVRDLLLALALPLLLLLLVIVVLKQPNGPLAVRFQRLAGMAPRLVPIGIGLIIALSLLRWLLQR